MIHCPFWYSEEKIPDDFICPIWETYDISCKECFGENEKMILKSAFNKILIPKKYDVNFTYSVKDFSQNEADKFNKVSDYFETAIMNLLSDMMDYCTEIEMEVEKK